MPDYTARDKHGDWTDLIRGRVARSGSKSTTVHCVRVEGVDWGWTLCAHTAKPVDPQHPEAFDPDEAGVCGTCAKVFRLDKAVAAREDRV